MSIFQCIDPLALSTRSCKQKNLCLLVQLFEKCHRVPSCKNLTECFIYTEPSSKKGNCNWREIPHSYCIWSWTWISTGVQPLHPAGGLGTSRPPASSRGHWTLVLHTSFNLLSPFLRYSGFPLSSPLI